MPLILATDTSTSVNSVALCRGESLLAEVQVESGRRHAERLIATVDWVLAEAGIPLAQVEVLAVATGPGSFTGLRIGTATFKGLALAAQKPLVGVPTLAALSRLALGWQGAVCTLLDARMQEVYAAAYRWRAGERHEVYPPRVVPVGDALAGLPRDEPVYFLGDGAVLYRDALAAWPGSAVYAPGIWTGARASSVALEAEALLAAGASTDAAAVAPVYLRASQAEQNRASKRRETRPV
ncbi:MAG: tRNA (adenosine(37)-N6)-threonylcarbamoyltransferase complex dimerization subunit type 1 TsaB [Candidatus Hydrogenedentota bacterium]